MALPSFKSGDLYSVPDEDARKDWVGSLHEWLRENGNGASLGPIHAPAVGRNFYDVHLTHADGTTWRLLMNPVLGVVGCVLASSEPGGHVPASQPFVDIPNPSAFERAGFTVGSAKELSDNPKTYLGELSDAEAKEIRYFGDSRIGDVIFNYYD